MRSVILAAGKGTRISRYLSGNPKCTVDIGNTKLIQYTIELLNKKNIHDIAIVIGYRGNVIREALQDYQVTFYENPFYDVTNSIASLWFAKDFFDIKDSYIIMNGDVYIEESLLDDILRNELSPVMFADSSRKECADFKFKYEKNILMKYGKELEVDDITGEYIGAAKFDSDFVPVFTNKLKELIYEQKHQLWWENVLYEMIGTRNIYVNETHKKFWAEVDYIEDYDRILDFRGFKADYYSNDLQ